MGPGERGMVMQVLTHKGGKRSYSWARVGETSEKEARDSSPGRKQMAQSNMVHGGKGKTETMDNDVDKV